MTANPILLQIKYTRIIQEFAETVHVSLDKALDFFYRSTLYQLIHEGVSDLHCMSDGYLVEELREEYNCLEDMELHNSLLESEEQMSSGVKPIPLAEAANNWGVHVDATKFQSKDKQP